MTQPYKVSNNSIHDFVTFSINGTGNLINDDGKRKKFLSESEKVSKMKSLASY